MDRAVVRIAVLFLFSVAETQLLQAARNCEQDDFNGLYGILGVGMVINLPAPFAGPSDRVGQVVADGMGNVSVQATASYNGTIAPESFQGTYTVTSGCTVTLSASLPLPGLTLSVTLVGVLAEQGGQMNAVLFSAPPALVGMGAFQKVAEPGSSCSNRDLSGSFEVTMQGTIVAQVPNTAGPFARVGTVDFNGSGQFTADTEAEYDGNAVAESFSGAYSVGSSCTLTMNYSLNSTAYTWTGTLTDHGANVDLIVSAPAGAVVAGTLESLQPEHSGYARTRGN